jgi:hypothetical protein
MTPPIMQQTVIGVSEKKGRISFGLTNVDPNHQRTKDGVRLMRLYIQRFYLKKSLELHPNWKNF